MLVLLSEVLALPALRAADIRVVTGEPSTTQIRWVHSSEVFEMGSLLAGGELLLTSGLGLHGRTAVQIADYVDQLADAGCRAIGIELGRTFFALPASMVTTAERRGLCLLEFRSVVPFERMVEDFHELLIHRRLGALGGTETVWRDLAHVVLSGLGLRALLDEISRVAGCVVELRDDEDRTVERSRIVSAATEHSHAVAVRTAAGPIGTLHLYREADQRTARIADQAAIVVALELGRTGDRAGRTGPAQSLITDLAAGTAVSGAEVARRLTEAGWTGPGGRPVVVAAVEVDPRIPLAEAVTAARHCFPSTAGPVLAGAVGGQVVVLLRQPTRAVPHQVRQLLQEAASRLQQEWGPTGRGAVVAAGDAVTDPADLTGAVATARDTLRTAGRFGIRSGAVLARDMAAQTLLTSGVDPHRLAAFVTEQIGPLIDHDRQHRTELLRTLSAYLDAGLSKASTAQTLGIRRQSLYDRLDRIEQLLGISFDDPGHRVGLAMALLAWQSRTGVDPGVGLGG